jgi:hypothetical protein
MIEFIVIVGVIISIPTSIYFIGDKLIEAAGHSGW